MVKFEKKRFNSFLPPTRLADVFWMLRGSVMRNLLGVRLGSMRPPVAQGLDCSAQIRCLSAEAAKAEVDKGDVFPITGIKKPTKGLFTKYPNECTAWYAHLTSVSIPFHERYVNLLKRTQSGRIPKQRAVLESVTLPSLCQHPRTRTTGMGHRMGMDCWKF